MIGRFIEEESAGTSRTIAGACFGVAGPILGESAELTNVPWRVDARLVAEQLGLESVSLLNDLQAMAYAVPVLQESETHTLQHGTRPATGNMALIAAGTGLGIAMLHNIDRRYVPAASEGGH